MFIIFKLNKLYILKFKNNKINLYKINEENCTFVEVTEDKKYPPFFKNINDIVNFIKINSINKNFNIYVGVLNNFIYCDDIIIEELSTSTINKIISILNNELKSYTIDKYIL